jgi:hypothetical protein
MINWGRLAHALEYYEEAGYTRLEVPWIVGHPAYDAMRPEASLPFVTLGGYLVASAEQSFFQELMAGRHIDRAVTLTPCFRHEVYDSLHLPYFMKVELIEAGDTSGRWLDWMIETAIQLFEHYIGVEVVLTPIGFDLVAKGTLIELGSYGRRRFGPYQWLYGTGLAEPRLSQAIAASGTGEML